MTENKTYIVYAKIDEQSRIAAVDSSAFLTDTNGLVKIDEGDTIRHYHAQGNFFEKPLYDARGIHRYMTDPVDADPERTAYHIYEYEGKQLGVYERTQAEMDADWEEPVPAESIEDRVKTVEGKTAELEESLDMLLSGVTEDE